MKKSSVILAVIIFISFVGVCFAQVDFFPGADFMTRLPMKEWEKLSAKQKGFVLMSYKMKYKKEKSQCIDFRVEKRKYKGMVYFGFWCIEPNKIYHGPRKIARSFLF